MANQSPALRHRARMLAERTAGAAAPQGVAEIQHMPAYADEFWKLYDGDTLLAEWRTPEATP